MAPSKGGKNSNIEAGRAFEHEYEYEHEHVAKHELTMMQPSLFFLRGYFDDHHTLPPYHIVTTIQPFHPYHTVPSSHNPIILICSCVVE